MEEEMNTMARVTGMTKVTFWKDGRIVETKSFRVSADETLWYRTYVAARDYGLERGYDMMKLDGEKTDLTKWRK